MSFILEILVVNLSDFFVKNLKFIIEFSLDYLNFHHWYQN